MSSDNYNRVEEQSDGRWYAWRNLDASSGHVPTKPHKTFDSFKEAHTWADEAYAEYGTEVGFKEASDDTK